MTCNSENDDDVVVGLKMRLKVDGQEVEVGPFVQRIAASAILGMISQLKGVDHPKLVEVAITVD